MVPVNPAATRLWRISDPILPRSRLAPTTATTRGSKNAFIDAVAAVRDRAAALFGEAFRHRERQDHVADAATRPSSSLAKPESRKTSSIRRLSPSTYASNVWMPCFARHAREALQQARADAVALQGIGYGERHFGAIGRLPDPVEAGEGHDPAAGLRRRATSPRDSAPQIRCRHARCVESGQAHESG